MRLLVWATPIALCACTSNALEIPEDVQHLPGIQTGAPDLATAPSSPDRHGCPGDDALQPIPIALTGFAASDPTTTATVEDGALVLGSSITGYWSESGILGAQSAGAPVDPSLVVRGARVCYSLSSPRTHLRQIRLMHALGGQDFLVDEDDTAHLDEAGAYCTDPTYFQEVVENRCLAVDGAHGPFLIFLAADFEDTADTITIQSVDLMVYLAR